MNTQPAYAPGLIPVWTFADKIRKARTLVGEGQREFAARIGITDSSLAAYETGRSTPRFRDATTLARRLQMATGIPSEWFLIEDDPNDPGTGYTPPTKKAPTRKGEGQALLPELDSNQQPAGYTPAPRTLPFPTKRTPKNTPTHTGDAIITPIIPITPPQALAPITPIRATL